MISSATELAWQPSSIGEIGAALKILSLHQYSSVSYAAFAGIYDVWRGKDDTELVSCAIITTTPNSLLSPIHNRMLVILYRDEEQDWLNPDTSEPEHLHHFLKPYPAAEMEAYPVSQAVNSPANDTPALIQPLP